MEHYARVPEEPVMGAGLPEPVRLRVMEELEGDASGLLAHFLDRGMSEEAAQREAEAWVGAKQDVWRELADIHRPLAVRWADRLLEPRSHHAERAGVVVAAMSLVAAAIPLRASLVVRAPFGTGWLVLALAAAIVVLAFHRAIVLWRNPSAGNGGGDLLALLGVGAPALGLLAAGLTMSRVRDGGLALWPAIEIASGTATVGLMAGLASGVFWSLHKAWHRISSPADERGV